MQNKCNTWMKYRNVFLHHKNANMGSSTVHLHGVRRPDRYAKFEIDYKNAILYDIKTYFYMI